MSLQRGSKEGGFVRRSVEDIYPADIGWAREFLSFGIWDLGFAIQDLG